tara:strand:+ start:394 stop:594 length:201 start_codon:yes stop_codon:yes gene_type:complete
MCDISAGLIVSACAMLANVVMIFGVSAHGDLGVAAGAFEVEPEYFNAQVVDVLARFFPHVKFSTDV